MTDLETFKKHTKRKLIVMYLATLLPITLVIVLVLALKEQVSMALVVTRYLLFAAIEAIIVAKIVNYHLILGKPEYCEKAYTALIDERNSFIRMKTLNLSFKIVAFVTGVLAIVFGFTNEYMFYVALAELAIMLLSYIFVKIYYIKKY